MKSWVVIPARMASTRLPGKPLAAIAGKPMIVRVMQQAVQARVDGVVAAVDQEQVFSAVTEAGFDAVMTGMHHQSGSDRVMEVASLKGWQDEDVVINVQGDEPLIPPLVIDQLVVAMQEDGNMTMATLSEPIINADDFLNPNVVKVVTDRNGDALYFSRAPIPFPRDEIANDSVGEFSAARHIGVYAFRVGALREFVNLSDSRLEATEKLEQLRWLEAGRQIRVLSSAAPVPGGVDTEEDRQRVENEILRRETGS